MTEHVRNIPVSIESEQYVIGAALMRNAMFQKLSALVSTADFSEAVHRDIWKVIATLIERNEAATVTSCALYLGDDPIAGGDGITPRQYLARLMAEAPVDQSALEAARIVRVTAARRSLIHMAEDIGAIARDMPVEETIQDVFQEVESRIEKLRPLFGGEASDFRSFDDVAVRAIDRISSAWQNQDTPRGLSTGLRDLDDLIGGLEAPDLIILGGRTAMGKTALALNITAAAAKELMARRAAGTRTGVVGFFSLEMGDTQLFDRMISAEVGIPSWRIRRPKGLSKTEIERIVQTTYDMRGLPLEIDQTGAIPIAQLVAKARSLKKRKGLELLVVDYLQLVTSKSTKRDANRSQEVTEISGALKALAKELHVPIVALAQVGRQVDDRDDPRPRLSDLRESGAIEQDADIVLFTFRQEYYLKGRKPQEGTEQHAIWQRNMTRVAGIAEIIVAKNRHGPAGTAEVGYVEDFTLFKDEIAPREIDPEEVRERAARKPTFTAEGVVLYGLLKSLTLSRSKPATAEQRAADPKLCKGALLVSVEDAKAAFQSQVLGPDTDEKTLQTRFRAAFLSLRKHEVAFYSGAEGAWTVWLPELASERSA